MKTSDFDYDLPPELIAQHPLQERSQARMMIVDRATGVWRHGRVADLSEVLRAPDLLVVNDTRVIPARLEGRKEATGGRVELLMLEERRPGLWEAMYGGARRPKPGSVLILAEGRLRVRVAEWVSGGRLLLEWPLNQSVLDFLEARGSTPLPPYIRRGKGKQARVEAEDRARYQTVYAREPGAVAAPTAGLHFTRELLSSLEGRGIGCVAITLHVGPGTFKPVKADDIEQHIMESERYVVPEATARAIRETRAAGGRIVAVGSTVVRALETAVDENGMVRAETGRSALFIRPPFRFRAVDAMLTNFHLPRSTLLMMISAMAGHELVRRCYAEAIRERYRFYSFGDCMLIL